MRAKILVVKRLYGAPKSFTSGSTHCFSVPQSTSFYSLIFLLKFITQEELHRSTIPMNWNWEMLLWHNKQQQLKTSLKKKKRRPFKHKSYRKHSLFHCPTRCTKTLLIIEPDWTKFESNFSVSIFWWSSKLACNILHPPGQIWTG